MAKKRDWKFQNFIVLYDSTLPDWKDSPAGPEEANGHVVNYLKKGLHGRTLQGPLEPDGSSQQKATIRTSSILKCILLKI